MPGKISLYLSISHSVLNPDGFNEVIDALNPCEVSLSIASFSFSGAHFIVEAISSNVKYVGGSSDSNSALSIIFSHLLLTVTLFNTLFILPTNSF